MKPDATFICDICRTEEPVGDYNKALAEKERMFPNVPIDDCAQVCDDCWLMLQHCIAWQDKWGSPPGPQWKTVKVGDKDWFVPYWYIT